MSVAVDPRRWSPRALTLKDLVDAAATRLPWLSHKVTPEGDYVFEGAPNLGDVIVWKIVNLMEEPNTDEALIESVIESMKADIGELQDAIRGLSDLKAEIVSRRRPRRR